MPRLLWTTAAAAQRRTMCPSVRRRLLELRVALRIMIECAEVGNGQTDAAAVDAIVARADALLHSKGDPTLGVGRALLCSAQAARGAERRLQLPLTKWARAGL